jgi:hypothetical protein
MMNKKAGYSSPTIVRLGTHAEIVLQNRASPYADGGYDSTDMVLLTQDEPKVGS